jgi:hypothetical protein
LQNGLQMWKRQTAQMATNVRKVSSILEDIGSKVQSIEQVRDIASNEVILKTVREKMQEELRKQGKLPPETPHEPSNEP